DAPDALLRRGRLLRALADLGHRPAYSRAIAVPRLKNHGAAASSRRGSVFVPLEVRPSGPPGPFQVELRQPIPGPPGDRSVPAWCLSGSPAPSSPLRVSSHTLLQKPKPDDAWPSGFRERAVPLDRYSVTFTRT